ncbi:Clp protease N-terminal domain-containing protein, partial [Streptomyces sp. NPDC003943]
TGDDGRDDEDDDTYEDEPGGDRRVRGLDLLAVLAADPGSRAAEVLRAAGVDRAALTVRIEELSQQV